MRSPSEDRTARARIRDEALRLFAERGSDAVTVREIAAAADVSPALIMRHYGTKEALRAVVDEHVVAVFEQMLGQATGGADPLAPASVVELVAAALPPDSPIPAYLGHMLLSGGEPGTMLFRRLHLVATDALTDLRKAGHADAGADPAVRAAFLLANDLAVLILRTRLADVLGVDPLSADGLRRWAAEVLTIYRCGLGGTSYRTAGGPP
ncbi:TetR/AcrR family transcriptional regulator [Nocardia sp. NPDC058497]|uniref:TetR/AcrR family transcriptional regulator n=1 Tax=Nocardia sp. NPDC058497 TaxID=3346529 RepID=UPI00365A85D4